MPAAPLDLRVDGSPVPPDRDAALRAAAPGACAEAFPDSGDAGWDVEATALQGERAWVRVRTLDEPPERYVLLALPGSGDGPRVGVALYESAGGDAFALLATEPGCPGDLPDTIIW